MKWFIEVQLFGVSYLSIVKIFIHRNIIIISLSAEKNFFEDNISCCELGLARVTHQGKAEIFWTADSRTGNIELAMGKYFST